MRNCSQRTFLIAKSGLWSLWTTTVSQSKAVAGRLQCLEITPYAPSSWVTVNTGDAVNVHTWTSQEQYPASVQNATTTGLHSAVANPNCRSQMTRMMDLTIGYCWSMTIVTFQHLTIISICVHSYFSFLCFYMLRMANLVNDFIAILFETWSRLMTFSTHIPALWASDSIVGPVKAAVSESREIRAEAHSLMEYLIRHITQRIMLYLRFVHIQLHALTIQETWIVLRVLVATWLLSLDYSFRF